MDWNQLFKATSGGILGYKTNKKQITCKILRFHMCACVSQM